MDRHPKLLCGHTKSGKPVYQYMFGEKDIKSIHPHHVNFHADDHFDAYAIFTCLTAREVADSRPNLDKADILDKQAVLHQREIVHELKVMMRDRNIQNTFDLRKYGDELVK